MNPFDTPDTPSVPVPSVSPAPATINIDTMLANLGQQTPATISTPAMQLSSLDKPYPTSVNPPVAEAKTLWIPSRVKKILSLMATIVLIIVGYWFISVQYPLETTSFMTSITSSFHSIIAIIQKNQDSSFMTGSSETLIRTDMSSWSIGDDPLATPLTDAIAEAASGFAIPSSSEQVRDTALSWSDTTSWSDSLYQSWSSDHDSSILWSWSAMIDTMNQTMAHAVAGSDAAQRESVRKKLLDMKGIFDQKMVDLSLSNNTLQLSLVKVALKNIDLTLSLSEQANDSAAWDEVDAKIETIEAINTRLQSYNNN